MRSRPALALAVLALSLGAAVPRATAQVMFPTHPVCVDTKLLSISRNADFPWYQRLAPGALDTGTFVRYVYVPPLTLTLDAAVIGLGVLPGTTQPLVAQVPGYTISETTTGYFYPERWGVREVSPGVHYWLRLPAQFVCKALRR